MQMKRKEVAHNCKLSTGTALRWGQATVYHQVLAGTKSTSSGVNLCALESLS